MADVHKIREAPDLATALRDALKIIAAQTRLLVAYRTGGQPPGAVLDALAKRAEVEERGHAALAAHEDIARCAGCKKLRGTCTCRTTLHPPDLACGAKDCPVCRFLDEAP